MAGLERLGRVIVSPCCDLASHNLTLPLAEGQPGDKEAAGEKAGKRALYPVVMEEGQNAVKPPGDRQREPDNRAPHGSEIRAFHFYSAQEGAE
jgi:hypothetical protein